MHERLWAIYDNAVMRALDAFQEFFVPTDWGSQPPADGYWDRAIPEPDHSGHDPLCHIDPHGNTGHICRTSYGQPVHDAQCCYESARADSVWDREED